MREPERRPGDFGNMPNASSRPYPTLIACIHEARAPSFAEIKRVVRRLRREIYPERASRKDRRIVLLALAALGGVPDLAGDYVLP